MEEAKSGGLALKNAGYQFDAAHTSVLQRAQTTLKTVLDQIGKGGAGLSFNSFLKSNFLYVA